MTTPYLSSQCARCGRVFFDANLVARCSAFSGGVIPREIAVGESDHTKPFPGDGGMMFIAKKEKQ